MHCLVDFSQAGENLDSKFLEIIRSWTWRNLLVDYIFEMLIICDFKKFSFCNMPRARDILSTLPQTLLSRQSLSSWVLIRSTQIFILCLQWENVFINIVWVHINWSDHTDGILVSPLSLPSHLENVFIIRCICLHFPSVYLSVWKIVAIYAIYIQPPRDRQSKNDKTGRKKIHFSNNNKKNRKSAKWYFL